MGRLVTGEFNFPTSRCKSEIGRWGRSTPNSTRWSSSIKCSPKRQAGRRRSQQHLPRGGNGDAFDLSSQGFEWGSGERLLFFCGCKRLRDLVKWNPSMLKLTGVHSNTDSGACRSPPSSPIFRVRLQWPRLGECHLRSHPMTSRVFNYALPRILGDRGNVNRGD